MTTLGQQAAAEWSNTEFATEWIKADSAVTDQWAYPRAIASALVAQDRPDVRLVIDIASGPGGFLEVFLDRFPDAAGVWTDASETMLATARERLARFGDRVTYLMGDMTDLAAIGLPAGADAVLTSRATHHLDRAGISAFYQEAASHLAPGGWLANMDHIRPRETWAGRLKAAKKSMSGRGNKPKTSIKHNHEGPRLTIQDNVDGLHDAGLDAEMPWKAFGTCLFVGRKAN